mmetsp:Transcript_17076/g.12227  ORF Transcript_17076/g.12227 Transcript_17076/m.12227 type:complete len:185 (+) Transcript_17076:515-1069(+)
MQQKMITLKEIKNQYIAVSASYYFFLFSLEGFYQIKQVETLKSIYCILPIRETQLLLGQRTGFLQKFDLNKRAITSTMQLAGKSDVNDMLIPLEDSQQIAMATDQGVRFLLQNLGKLEFIQHEAYFKDKRIKCLKQFRENMYCLTYDRQKFKLFDSTVIAGIIDRSKKITKVVKRVNNMEGLQH